MRGRGKEETSARSKQRPRRKNTNVPSSISSGINRACLIKQPFVFHTVALNPMKQLRLILRCVLWMSLFASLTCVQTATTQIVGESPVRQQSSSPPRATASKSQSVAPSVTPSAEAKTGEPASSDLANVETRVQPAVIWVTVFDAKGNLLRTESGFFISADGRFATTARAIEGGVNAVAKTGDGGIHNVSGILVVSKESDLAVLQADVKKVPFLELNKNGNPQVGTNVVVVGSGLAGSDGGARQTRIAAQQPDHLEIAGATPASSTGSPVVNDAGEVVGVVTAVGQQTTARPATALQSLLSRAAADTQARWPAIAETRPTPKSTPKPRVVYAPAPAFPPGVSQAGVSGTGRFRLSFDATGNVTNVQVVKSTGNPYFDQAAIKTLRQWKSAPSQGWAVTVPVTFQTR
jgi:TonB family protein